MQRSSANESANEIIRIAKLKFKERITNIMLFDVTDEPYKMFSIKFTLYGYFVIRFNYDRGHFGCSIVFGEDSVMLPSNIQWDDNCDLNVFWDKIDEQVRLRIPDKYLEYNKWL